MPDEFRIEIVTAEDVGELGFFCCKSKADTPRYQRKLGWLKDRFSEWMRIQILYQSSQ